MTLLNTLNVMETKRIENKIEQQSLVDIAYRRIKKLIIENDLKSGEKIRQEKMATEFGISKIPLIQALNILSSEHLIEKITRKGFYVRKFSKKELNEIFELRIAIELLSISNIIKNLTDEIEESLIDYKKKFKLYYEKKDTKKYYNLDVRFHHFLLASSGNDLILKIDNNFNLLLLGYVKGFVLDFEISYKQHMTLIDEILSKNYKKAEIMLKKHINSVVDKFNNNSEL